MSQVLLASSIAVIASTHLAGAAVVGEETPPAATAPRGEGEPAEGAAWVADPLGSGEGGAGKGDHLSIAAPLDSGDGLRADEPGDPRAGTMARIDLMLGGAFRVHEFETEVSASLELGQVHGFSGLFRAALLVNHDRTFVGVLEAPIGVGAVVRGRLKNRPLYASVGLTAGILVHRAATSAGVIHRVDPDFVVPIRLAWTIAGIGLSLALVQGVSARSRSYELQGVEIFRRHPYRIGLQLGLHWDIAVRRRSSRRGRSETSPP